MSDEAYSIKYPRRVVLRGAMTSLGRILLALLADVQINGRERLPKKGPIIMAGNHVAVLEAVMMAVYTPGMVEFLGAGDIPFDPNYAWIANTYDLIRVNRGNLDRDALQMGFDLLKQDGILGIFPEGGVWDPAQMQAQTGVAWLSYRAQVPVLPVGFGGIKGALNDALRFKHPHLIMNVGEVMPPVALDDETLSKKDNLQKAANHILHRINALIPEEEINRFHRRMEERYHLNIIVRSNGSPIEIPPHIKVGHGAAYARFLYNPVMMDVLLRNLKLPIKPIKRIRRQRDLAPVLEAWESILAYLEINPGYFTYRFGVEKGVEVKQALLELLELGKWVRASGYSLTVSPVRRFRNANTGARVIERGGCFPQSMG
jgi:1-acyl-sn-glycerol-3-phosphate acyltransferase